MSNPPSPTSPRSPRQDDLLSPVTQIVRNRADYLGEGQSDVGQRIDDDKLELFVTTDPAQAMLQQFAQLEPQFIAIHDVGKSVSLRLLSSVANSLGTKLQHLSIRRQGHGVPLASLPFVEVQGQGNRRVRVYTTDVDADSQARRQLTTVLLGQSSLSVLLVGELAPHVLVSALQPLGDAMRKGPWPNRQMLMIPLGGSAALAAQAKALSGPLGLQVRVTPQAQRTLDAWSFIAGTWNQLIGAAKEAPAGVVAADAEVPPVVERRSVPREPVARAGEVAASMPAATPVPAATPMPPTRPMPPTGAPSAPVAAGGPPWPAYLKACAAIKGMVSACLFDFRTVRLLGHVGARPEPEALMSQGMTLFSSLAETGRALGLGPSQPDATVTLTGHHLILHPLPGRPGVLLHAVLDASISNLTLARMQLQRVDTTVLGAPPARS